MPFAEASSTLRLRPLPVLPRVMTSTLVVHREHRSISTRAGEEVLSLGELDSLEEDDEDDDQRESTDPSLGKPGGDIVNDCNWEAR